MIDRQCGLGSRRRLNAAMQPTTPTSISELGSGTAVMVKVPKAIPPSAAKSKLPMPSSMIKSSEPARKSAREKVVLPRELAVT